MLAECADHGYYRGEKCPVCEEKGKFLMNDREVKKLSGTMAGILRHFPEQFDVEMDEHGWVDIDDMVNAIKNTRLNFHWLRKKHVMAIVETDEKGRYQDVDELFYPVTEEEAEIVLEQGLFPTDRTKVHLSESMEKAMEAGKVRTENPVILRIDAARAMEDGVDIRKASKEVCISDDIDAKYISRVE